MDGRDAERMRERVNAARAYDQMLILIFFVRIFIKI